MGRRLFGWVALLFIVAAVIHPAEAKDRKAAAEHDRAAVSDMIASRAARPVSIRQDASVASVARSSNSSARLEASSRSPNGKPIAPLADHQPARSNPFRFNIGPVAVQPAIVSGIKGAQFSIGF